MIELVSILGVLATLRCNDIVTTSQLADSIDGHYCQITTQVYNRIYYGKYKKSCIDILKICDIKVEK